MVVGIVEALCVVLQAWDAVGCRKHLMAVRAAGFIVTTWLHVVGVAVEVEVIRAWV